MEDKVTPARIGAYATRLARRVCATALANQEAIEGPALLSLTPVRQLNLLVLHGLMHRWKQEATRLRSPYFNYEAPEVQQAVLALGNALSRHIRVGRAELEALVTEAAADALGLAFDPATTYAQRFVGEEVAGATFTPDALRADLKYVEVNKPLLDGFIGSLPPASLDRAAVLSHLKRYTTAHFRELAAPDELLRGLSEIEPVTLADLREPAGSMPAPGPTSAPTVAPPTTAPPVEAPAPPKPPTAPPVAAPPAVEVPKPARPQLAPLVNAEAPVTPLHEKLRHDHEKVNLNDQLRSKVPEAPGLAEVFESKAKVESIVKAITTNQKYAFIAELFDGNRAGYDAAIERLDAQPDAAQARACVTNELAPAYTWTGKDEHVQKLMRLIDRKFA